MAKKQNGKAAVPKIVAITADLHNCFLADSKNVVRIGELLSKAKREIAHGDFLTWAASEFSLSAKTTERYMDAHKFMIEVVAPLTKSSGMTNLRLRPTAIYALAASGITNEQNGEFIDDDRSFEVTVDDISAVLKEAKEKWVGPERLKQILRDRHPPEPEAVTPRPPAFSPEEPISDGETKPPTPDKPPAPNPAPPDPDRFVQGQLVACGSVLKTLATKSADRFDACRLSPDDLDVWADFLHSVATKIRARAEKYRGRSSKSEHSGTPGGMVVQDQPDRSTGSVEIPIDEVKAAPEAMEPVA